MVAVLIWFWTRLEETRLDVAQVIHPFGKLVTIVDIATPQTLLDAWGRNLTFTSFSVLNIETNWTH